MRKVVTAVLSFWLCTTATQAAPQPSDLTASVEPTDSIIDAYYSDIYALKFERALADVKKLRVDPSNKEGQSTVAAMRAVALLGLKRESEARSLITQIHEMSPREPYATSTLFEGALLADRLDVAADAVDDMIARYPDALRDQNRDLINYFLRKEPKSQDRRNEDRRINLARIGYGGNTAYGHSLVFGAVKLLVDRGEIAAATELLGDVQEPQYYENMLVQRRFAALWPKLEELGGPRLEKLRDSSVAAAERAYTEAPNDAEKLQDYADALRHAGRLGDAIALKAKLPATPEAMSSVDEKTGWAVNSIAYALYDAGRLDEGDRLFAMLNDPPRKDASWRVSMIINRLEMLVSGGRFEQAASLVEATELSAKTDGNEFAQQLVRRLRYCILSSLGKKDEALRVLPEVLEHADDALQPTVEGLLCAGNADKAEELALAALSNADKAKRHWFEQQFVRALQPEPLTDDDPSVWASAWKAMRQRPAIAAAYERLGRDLPSQYLAQKTLSPTEQ